MRVLQVHTHYRQAGGEDGVVATEARLLREAGHDVHTWRSENPPGSRAALSLAAAPWNPAAASTVREAAERFKPDIAHIHNTWFATSPAAVSALHGLGLPVVMTLHNFRLMCAAATLYRDGAPCHDCVGGHPWHAVRYRCYRDSVTQSAVAAATIALQRQRDTWHRSVERFLALSEFGRELFVEGGLAPEKVVVKANSVADPGPRDRPPSASRTVVFLGRLSEEKGIRTLLEAWDTKQGDLNLLIIGTGPLEGELQRHASPTVQFAGQLSHEQVVSHLLTARALVFPSTWYEGQPLVALEAAAAGLPVLLSDLGAMPELFAPGSNDLLFPAGDVEVLGQRLRQLGDDAFVDRFGELARRRFEQRYTHAAAMRRLETIYGDARGARRLA